MNKKYYWLKLKKDFFTDKRIKKLRKIAGGDTYTIIYLKMQLLSLQDDGILYFDNIEDTFEEEIALQIDEDVEDVKITIGYLINSGLLKQSCENEYELVEAKKCIGSETSSAERMRNMRAKRSIENTKNVTMLQNVTKCYTEIEKEKEKDIEIDNKEKNIKKESFKKPTFEEIEQYCKERNSNVDAKTFYEYFETGGWKDSKGNKVKNWKQKIITWEKHSKPIQKESLPSWFNQDLEIKGSELTNEEREFIKKVRGDN